MENKNNQTNNNIATDTIGINQAFLQEIKHLKKVTDIKRDLYAIELLENLLADQETELK